MSEALNDIEAYFTGSLSTAQKEAFENRCLSDPAFAGEVAFYISLRDQMKQDLHDQKKAQFAELHEQLSIATPARSPVVRMRPFIAVAAACVLLFFAWTIFGNKSSVQTAAGNYIETNFTTLSINMGDAGADRLQAGIAAYNAKNFSEAEKIFQSLHNTPQQSEAVKYLGILYLTNGNYTKALSQFDTLSQNAQLYANPGLFYQAVTLLKRAAPGDKVAAKILLQQVVAKNLPGAREAKEWLKDL